MPVQIDDLLRVATSNGASDLHLKAGAFPYMRVGGELPNPSNSPGLSDRAPRYVLLGCDCGSVDAIDFHGDGVDVFLPSAVVLAERTTLDDLLSDAARLNTFKSIATSLLSMNDPNANDQGRKGIHNTFWAV